MELEIIAITSYTAVTIMERKMQENLPCQKGAERGWRYGIASGHCQRILEWQFCFLSALL